MVMEFSSTTQKLQFFLNQTPVGNPQDIESKNVWLCVALDAKGDFIRLIRNPQLPDSNDVKK